MPHCLQWGGMASLLGGLGDRFPQPNRYLPSKSPAASCGDLYWLRVLGTAERSQVDQRIRQQLHPIVPLLDAFKTKQQPLKLIFPRKGPIDTHRTGCKFSVAQTLLASAKVAGNRLIRGRCSQKNGWYFVAAHGTGMR